MTRSGMKHAYYILEDALKVTRESEEGDLEEDDVIYISARAKRGR